MELISGCSRQAGTSLVDIDREELVGACRDYFNPRVSDEHDRGRLSDRHAGGQAVFPPGKHASNSSSEGCSRENIVRFSYRPLDDRWLYWEPTGKVVWTEKRAEYFAQVWDGNIAFTAAAAIRKGNVEGPLPCHASWVLDI